MFSMFGQTVAPVASWQEEGGRGGNCLPLLNFGLSENCRRKMQNLDLKTPHFGQFGSKNEFFSTHNCLRRKFGAVCRKIATSCHDYFFNLRRRRVATQSRECRTAARRFLARGGLFMACCDIKVHLVQHDILWPVRRTATSELYDFTYSFIS